MKRCACCHRTYTAEQFAALPLVGVQFGLTLRNCPCGSTLAMVEWDGAEVGLYAGPLTKRGVL